MAETDVILHRAWGGGASGARAWEAASVPCGHPVQAAQPDQAAKAFLRPA